MRSMMIEMSWLFVEKCVNVIHRDVFQHLCEVNQNLGCIIGLSRGGLIPAVMLSHRFNVRMVPLLWQTRDQDQKTDVNALTIEVISACNRSDTILIVDDIVDSGKTLKGIDACIVSYLKNLSKRGGGERHVDIIYACLVKKVDLEFDVISGIKIEDERWVVFPWEAAGVAIHKKREQQCLNI